MSDSKKTPHIKSVETRYFEERDSLFRGKGRPLVQQGRIEHGQTASRRPVAIVALRSGLCNGRQYRNHSLVHAATSPSMEAARVICSA